MERRSEAACADERALQHAQISLCRVMQKGEQEGDSDPATTKSEAQHERAHGAARKASPGSITVKMREEVERKRDEGEREE